MGGEVAGEISETDPFSESVFVLCRTNERCSDHRLGKVDEDPFSSK
jgi:hypothetical protein